MAELLNVPFDLIELYEHSLVELLSREVAERSELVSNEWSILLLFLFLILQKLKGFIYLYRRAEETETKRRDKIRKIKRYASVGVATIAGGTLIGLTGGLAAPFIGVGIGTILGGASAAAIASTTGVAIIGSIFGVAGAGLTGRTVTNVYTFFIVYFLFLTRV